MYLTVYGDWYLQEGIDFPPLLSLLFYVVRTGSSLIGKCFDIDDT